MQQNQCNKCGSLFDVGQRFCINCGERFKYSCPRCNNYIESAARYCRTCGSELDWGTEGTSGTSLSDIPVSNQKLQDRKSSDVNPKGRNWGSGIWFILFIIIVVCIVLVVILEKYIIRP
jgi:RNA polymerase subunit RPABC4/transcription elongation factor Spt4